MPVNKNTAIRVLHPGPTACPAGHDLAADVLAGLSRNPKELPSVYFYDKTGSELFRRITRLSDYYPTGCETEILRRYGWAIARLFGRRRPFNLIELGVGEGKKTSILIESLVKDGLQFDYVPVDICADSVRQALKTVGGNMAGADFRMNGIVSDYSAAVRWTTMKSGRRNIVLFLGSTIGNFQRDEAIDFLAGVANDLRTGDFMFIGFDLKKDSAVLHRAYNDRAGLTGRFNLNLLARINREIGADFDLAKFGHHGSYNEELSAMESWLTSLQDQVVHMGETGAEFYFRKGEKIHTEYSHKYSVEDIHGLAERAGFSVMKTFFDSRKYFADSLWKVR